MWLYSVLLLCSFLVPIALSFDKKLQFYMQWNAVLPSIIIIALIYIVFDIYLTKLGVWGFNPRYHSNIVLFGLPLEEWLFFLVIPYSSIFLHQSLVLYFPQFQLSKNFARALTLIIILFVTIVIIFNPNKIYTVYIFSFLIIALILSLFDKTRVIRSFYISFLLILIPFVIVNAILTGSFIEEEVVWYNDNANLGIRFLTIPIEDFGYAFSLILFNLLLINKLNDKFKNKQINN